MKKLYALYNDSIFYAYFLLIKIKNVSRFSIGTYICSIQYSVYISLYLKYKIIKYRINIIELKKYTYKN